MQQISQISQQNEWKVNARKEGLELSEKNYVKEAKEGKRGGEGEGVVWRRIQRRMASGWNGIGRHAAQQLKMAERQFSTQQLK